MNPKLCRSILNKFVVEYQEKATKKTRSVECFLVAKANHNSSSFSSLDRINEQMIIKFSNLLLYSQSYLVINRHLLCCSPILVISTAYRLKFASFAPYFYIFRLCLLRGFSQSFTLRLLTDQASDHHVVDLVVAPLLLPRRPCLQDTFGLPVMAVVNSIHHLLK